MNVMGLTRRNTIIGLGALAGGAGVIGATGAFTSVEAERSVEVNTAGDDSAQLGIDVDSAGDFNGIGGGSGDEVTIDANNLNLNARTRFEGALEITANGSGGDWDISIMDDFGGSDLFYTTMSDTPDPGSYENGSRLYFVERANSGVLSTGNTVTYDVILDLVGVSSTGDLEGSNNIPAQIVIEATEQSQ